MKGNQFLLRKDGVIIFCLIIIHSICWFAMKPIFPDSDPLCYFLNAKKILNHEYILTTSVQDHRFGVFVPQALFISIFGENPYTINLWQLLCSLMTILLVYYFALTGMNRISAFVAALLMSVNVIQIIYSSVVFPDMIASLFSLCCVYFIFKGRKDPAGQVKNSILFILFFSSGFVAKESIVLLLPFLVIIFWLDWKQRKQISFLRNTFLLIVLFGAILFLISKILTHDYFFFLNSFRNYDLFIPFPDFGSFLKRVSYEPLLWLNSQPGYIFILLFAIPSFISGITKKDSFSSLESFFSLYFIVLLMALWWGSCSIIHWGAAPMTDRRWMMLIAPLCILSSITIYKIVHNNMTKNFFYGLMAIFILLVVINGLQYSLQRGLLFFSFAIMLAILPMLPAKMKYISQIKTVLILLPFVFLAFYFLWFNSNYVVKPPV